MPTQVKTLNQTMKPAAQVVQRPQATSVNVPQVKMKRYVPPAQKSVDFGARANKWMSQDAQSHYEPVIIGGGGGPKSAVHAWCPLPMFSSQEPSIFGPARYDGDESQFDEWAYATPLVCRAGTDFTKAITFCPYGEVTTGSEDFISSPYMALYNFVTSMNREKKFAQSSPWFGLLNFREKSAGGKTGGNYLPNLRRFYLMASIMLLNSKEEYNRDTRNRIPMQECFYNPQTLGKGLGPDEKISIVAVSQQIWNDLTKAMNTRGPNGDWFYPNPVNPDQLAVFYAWKHRGAACPVPGVKSSTDIDGMSGTVAGALYNFNGQQLGPPGQPFQLPRNLLTQQGTPSNDYYAKIPMHVGDTINYMDDHTMIKELAMAFSDAKAIFELAYARTDFEQHLNDPEIASIFGSVPQAFIYDTSIFEGEPVSVQVQQPVQVQQTPQPPQMQQQVQQQPYVLPTTHPGQPMQMVQHPSPPTQMVQLAQIPNATHQQQPQAPNMQAVAPPQMPMQYAMPPVVADMVNVPPETPGRMPASTSDVYVAEDNVTAVDINGFPYLDAAGNTQDVNDFMTKVDGVTWNP